MENADFIKNNGSFDYDLWLLDRVKENTIEKEDNDLDKRENDLNLNKEKRKENG